ncbi:MAG: acyl-CoA dehydrogenase family protein [Chloroflexi bacterium]|nr:acyl-CoA dehydrogenase family protein [Chloroflexota bacterium]
MRFTLTPELQAWQKEVGDWVEKELPKDIEGGEDAYNDDNWPKTREFRKKLGKRGWVGIGWPKEHGGMGASVMEQVVFNETMVYHHAPLDPQIYQVCPAIMMHGSDDLKKRFLDATARQEIVWCQGFSEPNSGSDLASLQTKAVKDGDEWVINGSKIWTSYGHRADWIHILVRTDQDVPKHKGITYLIADMHSPGVRIQPLINIAGSHGFNQVFFDNVRVPSGNIIGEVNRGWYVAMTTLDNERSGIVQVSGARRQLHDLLDYVVKTPRTSPVVRRDLAIRHRLAELAIEAEMSRNLAYRVGWLQHNGKTFDMPASISKTFASELSQRISRAAMDSVGLYAQFWRNVKHAPLGGRLPTTYLGSIASTIAAGTSEINRNIIATRGLGLPR